MHFNYLGLGSAIVAAGFPWGKRPEFPRGEISIGTTKCKKKKKKKNQKKIKDANFAPSRSDVNICANAKRVKSSVRHVMRCVLLMAAFPTAAVAKHRVAVVTLV